MFSNAEYVDFTIGKDTITITLDLNASFDGLYNLSNLTGTDISAAGSSAEFDSFSITYQNFSHDQKWKSAPYFDVTENRLYLLSGSGLITKLKLEITENSKDKTIPKVVGVGDFVGQFQFYTVAEGTNSNYNYLDSNIKGVGYADLYVQYAPDTSYENVTFIPTFSDCEKAQLYIRSSSGSESDYEADILGVANGAKPISGVSPDLILTLYLDVEYFPITYRNDTHNQTWELSPYFNDTENRLYLVSGSGLLTKLKLAIEEDTIKNTIPKVVGVGDLVGALNIETFAAGTNSNYNYLESEIDGVGYADLYVQYAHDTSYENIIFIPTFSDCERLEAEISISSESFIPATYSFGTQVYYQAHILGVANGAKPISGVSHDLEFLLLDLDVEYFPTTYNNVSYDQTWEVSPYFDDTENRLYLVSGSGLITILKLAIEEDTIKNTIPKVVGVGDLVGDFHIETFAEGTNSNYNYLDSNIKGVGYADLYVQYAPDTSYENITFIPTFSDCEILQLSTNTFCSFIEYDADVLGYANGVEYLNFNNLHLDKVAINERFDLKYHSVNISGDVFDERWSVKPEQYNDTLVILRGTGDITKLNFTFDDRNTTHPEIISYGYLRGPYNLTANILPYYMNVIANGTDVLAMDESGRGGFGVTFGI